MKAAARSLLLHELVQLTLPGRTEGPKIKIKKNREGDATAGSEVTGKLLLNFGTRLYQNRQDNLEIKKNHKQPTCTLRCLKTC